MIVIDTNVMVYLVTGRGREGEQAARLLRQDPEWFAPPILPSEVRNVLLGFVRRGGVTASDAAEMNVDAETAVAGRIGRVDGAEVITTALNLGLSAYDAEFVVLARALGVDLVTRDRQILAAAPDCARAL